MVVAGTEVGLNMKKTYNVIWTYVANYHAQSVEAETPEKAMEMVCGFYMGNPEFVKKSSIYVFEGVPVLEIQKGENVTPAVRKVG